MLSLLWLLSQTVGGTVSPIADALSGHGVVVAAHMEDDAGTHCPPAHSDLGCHLAASTGTPSGIDAAAVQGGVQWRVVLSRPEAWEAAPPVGAVRTLPLGRGPPLV